jgi:NAD-dependent SIR2 family protein deacetylase
MKRCSTCGEEKSTDSFTNNRSREDGKATQCKSCVKKYRREYRLKNEEKLDLKSKEYVKALEPWYIAQVLRMPLSQLTPELIELKRAQLEMTRLTKQLKKEIQNGN